MATKQAPNPIPVALLVRVSTDKQDTSRQVHELQQVAREKGWKVVEVIEEAGISGNAADDQRHGLARAQVLASEGTVKKVLVLEVSRLARRNSTAHRFIEDLEQLGVSLYWHAQRIETLLADGRRNPAASIMFSLLADMARNERETLVERINSGLAKARRNGRTLGRPKGTRLMEAEFLAKHKDVQRLLRAGQSIRNAAKIAGKGVSTVQRVARVVAQAKAIAG